MEGGGRGNGLPEMEYLTSTASTSHTPQIVCQSGKCKRSRIFWSCSQAIHALWPTKLSVDVHDKADVGSSSRGKKGRRRPDLGILTPAFLLSFRRRFLQHEKEEEEGQKN